MNPRLREQAERKLAELPRRSIVRGMSYDKPVQVGPRNATGVRMLHRLKDPVERLAFHMRVDGFGHFVREHKFHPERKWRIDIAFLAEKLAIEVEGVTYKGGRHQRPAGFENDCVKYNEMVLMGWKLLRFTPRQITKGRVMTTIRRALGTNEKGD